MPPILQQLQSMSQTDITEAIANSHPESDNPNAHSMKADALAMDLVHDRHSKRQLVDLVRWLILGAPLSSMIRCDQVGCRNGEFDWPSSKGLCPKCGGTGTITENQSSKEAKLLERHNL